MPINEGNAHGTQRERTNEVKFDPNRLLIQPRLAGKMVINRPLSEPIRKKQSGKFKLNQIICRYLYGYFKGIPFCNKVRVPV